MKIFLALMFVVSFRAQALEVDEKLTVRILRTSESRKTVMINRGTEDGLVEGDHAKFIVTAGIVARGTLVKVSPSRSVWSIYRLVNADFIVNDSVMSIKITPPVKITKDDTKNLVQEDVPTKTGTADPTQLGIPLADGAQDIIEGTAVTSTNEDLKGLDDEPSTIPEKNIEVFGILNISGLSSTAKTDSGGENFSNSQSYHHIGLGGEIYPQREREWYSKFSAIASMNLMRLNSQAYNGSTASNDVTEFSFGVNWHPTKLPSTINDFIPFIHLSFNAGSSKSTYKSGSEGNGTDTELESNGKTSGFSVGFGYKYYLARGFGARILLDYYSRAEKYEEDTQTDTFNKTVSGPRFMIGLGYRF